jgi:hypothetical protein
MERTWLTDNPFVLVLEVDERTGYSRVMDGCTKQVAQRTCHELFAGH